MSFNVRDDRIPVGESRLRCFNCKEVFSHNKWNRGGPLILIANENQDFCKTVANLLMKNGYDTESVYDGIDALMKVQEKMPAVVLLDIALPGMLGFEVCESVRNIEAVKDTKILLIAAIYDKTRYKRAPVSLYGANDYIEKHHIHDLLIKKIENLLAESPAEKVLPRGGDEKDPLAPDLKGEERSNPCGGGISDSEKEHEKARRLARIIVSDIALYNEHLFGKGIENDNYHELLKEDFEEGNRFFRERVPREIWGERDYLMEFFEDLIKKHVKPN